MNPGNRLPSANCADGWRHASDIDAVGYEPRIVINLFVVFHIFASIMLHIPFDVLHGYIQSISIVLIYCNQIKHLQKFYYFSFIVLIHWHRYQHTKEWFIYECIYDKWITNHSQLFNGSKMDIWKLETVPRFRSNISRQIINMF